MELIKSVRRRFVFMAIFVYLLMTACLSSSMIPVVQYQSPDNPVNVGESVLLMIDMEDAGPVTLPDLEELINEGGEVLIVDANTSEAIPGLTYSCGRVRGCELTFSTPGTYTIKIIVSIVEYQQKKVFESASHTVVVIDPNLVDTTLAFRGYTWDVDNGPIETGDRVGFWLTLTNDGSAPDPTGLVTVSDGVNSCVMGAQPIPGSGTPDIGCFLYMMNVGGNTITAEYPGDENNNPASATMTLDVEDGEVVNTLLTFEGYSWDTSQGPIEVNTSVSFVLQLWTAEGLPEATGTIDVRGESVDSECEITVPNEPLACNLFVEHTGANYFTAEYLGDENHDTATAAITLTVGLFDSQMDISTDPSSPSGAGETVTISVEMDGLSSGELPGGDVVISVPGDGYSCTASLQGDETESKSKASCNWTPSGVGDYTINVDYAGGYQFNPNSGSVSHTVGLLASTTIIESIVSPSYSLLGQTAYFNVSVSGSGGIPTGDVEVSGAGGSCTVTLDENGEGSCSYQMNQIGWNQTITASYEGDSIYDGSSTTESYGVTEPTPGPDSDGDGVPDSKDACPNEGDNGYGLEANGCPTLG